MNNKVFRLIPDYILLSLGLTLLIGMIIAQPGVDNIVDVMNYHAYNGWAITSGEWWNQFHPAYIHTYFQNYIDVFHWLLLENLDMWAVLLVLKVIQISVIIPLYLIGKQLFPSFSAIRILAISILSAATELLLSQLGTFNGDVISAIPILYSIWLAIKYLRSGNLRFLAAAGFLVGLGLSLKLTNLIFFPIFAAFLILIIVRKQFKAASVLIGSAALIFIASFLPHAVNLLKESGSNPLFPMYNQIFKSYRMEEISLDQSGLLSHIEFLPSWLTLQIKNVTSNMALYILALLTIILALYAVAAIILKKTKPEVLEAIDKVQLTFALSIIPSFMVWAIQFNILRYSVGLGTLTVLGGFAAISVLFSLSSKQDTTIKSFGLLIGLMLLMTVSPSLTFPYQPNLSEKLFPAKNLVELNKYDAVILTGPTPSSWLAVLNRDHIKESGQLWLSTAFNREDAKIADQLLENKKHIGFITHPESIMYANKNLATLGYTLGSSAGCTIIQTGKDYGVLYNNMYVCDATYTGVYSYEINIIDKVYLNGESSAAINPADMEDLRTRYFRESFLKLF